MSSSSAVTIIESGTEALSNYLTTLLPVIIPVAVGLAVLFGIWYFIKGSARRRV